MDEIDLQLVNVLQIAPRVSWTTAGEILGLSASAVAARWTRLADAGVAWVAVYPRAHAGSTVLAYLDVSCRPTRRADLAGRLSEDPRILSIMASAGASDFTLTVSVASLGELARLIFDELVEIRGVTDTLTRIVTTMHSEGSLWRLDALDNTQVSLAREAASLRSERSSPMPEAERQALVWELMLDPRATVADLARLVDGNPATVRRQLTQLLTAGEISIRCEASTQVTGWPIECSWLARVSPSAQSAAVKQLRTLAQLRMCASVTGDANLVFTTVSRSLEEFKRLEQWVGVALPMIQVTETLVNLRTIKRVGHLIDADGYATGKVVPPV